MAALCKPETQVIDRSGPLPGRVVLERDEEVSGAAATAAYVCVPSWFLGATPSSDATRRTSLGTEVATRVNAPGTPTTSRPRAFLILIGGANLPPKELDSGIKVSHRAAVPASDESESDSSPVLPSDRDNNNVFVQPGASPSGFAVAGRSDAFSKHSKKIRLSASDCVVRRLESIMENELTCAICSELFVDAAMLQCGHTFCSYCIHNWRQQKNVCPFCLAAIGSVTRSFVVDNIIDELVCFNPELKRFREALAHSRSAASYGDSSKN
ncbi:hypothetical protein HPB51_011941 [Rhipicephalus microplus]|uniref:RING-type domain-containing protein n=1 Tax=Rhipicephalus microplus TaxID=6941 RepID=A0A9J6F1K3_RHIMP|nr:hypothetical protein HPB51_011941 [Rhipicephalus microplus]